jgi:hypothetical protein
MKSWYMKELRTSKSAFRNGIKSYEKKGTKRHRSLRSGTMMEIPLLALWARIGPLCDSFLPILASCSLSTLACPGLQKIRRHAKCYVSKHKLMLQQCYWPCWYSGGCGKFSSVVLHTTRKLPCFSSSIIFRRSSSLHHRQRQPAWSQPMRSLQPA